MTIKEALEDVTLPALTLTYDTDKSIIYSQADIKFIFLTQYPSWIITNTGFTFHDLWTNFVSLHRHQYERIAKAMYSEYSPVENYDRYEESTNARTGTDTTTYSGTETYGKAGKEINKNGTDGIVTEEYTSGFNEAQPVIDNKTVTKGEAILEFDNRQDTKSFTNRQDATSHNTSDTINSHIHGNIGVMTAQSMILEETQIRSFMHNILLNICHDFINAFCFI